VKFLDTSVGQKYPKPPIDKYRSFNAPVEAFFKTIKAELIWRMKFETRNDAERKIFGYINDFYNPRRRHSALGNISPAAYEKLAA